MALGERHWHKDAAFLGRTSPPSTTESLKQQGLMAKPKQVQA